MRRSQSNHFARNHDAIDDDLFEQEQQREWDREDFDAMFRGMFRQEQPAAGQQEFIVSAGHDAQPLRTLRQVILDSAAACAAVF